MSDQQQTQRGSGAPPEARAAMASVASNRRNALDALGKAFTDFKPLAIVINEGKSAASSVIRNFLDGIGDDVAVARVPAANSNAIAGMRDIIRAFGFDPKHLSVGRLEDLLTMFLSHQSVRHRRTIICVDDAQVDALWLLDRVQYLVNLETEEKYGLMVILSGRPGLHESLENHPLGALSADVAQRITIAPLARDEANEYVRGRTEARVNSDVDHLIQRHTISLVHKLSRGVPVALKKFYAKCRSMANGAKSPAVTAGVVQNAVKQPRQERVTQLSDDPARTAQGNGSSPAIGRLIVHINGEIIQKQLHKQDHILIGRSKMCDLRLVPHEVSRHHAIVVNSANGTELVDLRTTNGTFVDGRPIDHHPLQDNDAISIGGCTIRYITEDD